MKYLPPFELIRRSIEISTVRGELRVNVSYENFVAILRMMILGIEVNEAWYARTYDDIGSAVQDGVLQSAKQHGSRPCGVPQSWAIPGELKSVVRSCCPPKAQ